MKNASGTVIYVGKAKNLRRRLGQYFQASRQPGKIQALVKEIAQIDVILVTTEVESLILENNLIKRYKPHYNILLIPDESGYGYVVETAEEFPRFLPFKRNRVIITGKRPGLVQVEKRFGPYLSRSISVTLLKCINESCSIRTCDPLPHKICYLYHLKRCSGPCEGLISEEDYAKNLEKAEGFLTVPHLSLIDYLSEQMNTAAAEMEFERAAHIRNQIQVLKTVFEKQVVERDVKHDQDVVYLNGRHALILHLKKGALIGLDWLPNAAEPNSLESFLLSYYQRGAPAEIITSEQLGPSMLEAIFNKKSHQKVIIHTPERGVKRDLIDIARINYEYQVSLWKARSSGDENLGS